MRLVSGPLQGLHNDNRTAEQQQQWRRQVPAPCLPGAKPARLGFVCALPFDSVGYHLYVAQN
ncbi:MAG: hypothetical protein R2856_26945 [Caldilineaceae bacterium]